MNSPVTVTETARASLPVEGAENAVIASFRAMPEDIVHLALIVGDISGDRPVLTRVHSSCITGDVLGSLRCDCGDQLHKALEMIKASGRGIILYLNQEGRGIGITNKLRAYALQEQGMDTFEANLALGFNEDERDFSVAAHILKKLGVSDIELLTNNPQKMQVLEANGITISKRIGLATAPGKHNHAYINAKASKAGHLF